MTMLEIKKTHDGVLLARRLDGKQLTPADRAEAKRIAAAESRTDPAANPILAVGDWYPEFHRLHRTIVKETPDFDYCEVRERKPELYREIKAKEAEIDSLGPARLSEVLALMHEWRELIIKADFEQRAASKVNGIGAETALPAVDSIMDDNAVAVLIDSSVLGGTIWFSLKDGWRPDEADGVPIFYASELPMLRTKTAEQLRSIFNLKRAFGGGMVKQ